MTAAEELADSLKSFAQSCNENDKLMTMIKDWNRTMQIQPTDLPDSHTLKTDAGTVTTALGAPTAPDLTIQATSELLAQIFYGELSPNEPYNDGTLRIQGPEEDIVRLDFVIAMLWE